jgi:cytochrome P450
MTSLGDLEHFDIYDPDVADHLYEVTDRARAVCPVGHTDKTGGLWYVTQYRLAKKVIADPQTYSSAQGINPGVAVSDDLAMAVTLTDPPVHRDLRKILDRFFSRRAMELHAPAISEVARGLVDKFLDKGELEVIHDYAQPLTAAVLASVVFGLDYEAHREQVLEVAREVEVSLSSDNAGSPEKLAALAMKIIEDRRSSTERRDDVAAALLEGTVGGEPLTDPQIIANLLIILGAGLDTTKSAIGSAIWRLTQDPELEGSLRSPDWTRGGLDEFLRIDAPVIGLCRTATKDTTLDDYPIKQGDQVLVMFAAANRDEAVFERPDEVVLDRVRNPHLAFGAGIHRCLGSNLARIQISIAINELLDRTQNLRLRPGYEVHWQPGIIRHAVDLPVVFDRRG